MRRSVTVRSNLGNLTPRQLYDANQADAERHETNKAMVLQRKLAKAVSDAKVALSDAKVAEADAKEAVADAKAKSAKAMSAKAMEVEE